MADAAPALVSFLGVPGWGPLHLQLAAGADPPGLARRLRRAQAAVGAAGTPSALLAAFLRQERDAHPLPRPWGERPAAGRRLSHRYRLVCPGPGHGLRLDAWCWQGSARGWRRCAAALPLARFLEAWEPPARAAPVSPVAPCDPSGDPSCDKSGPGLRLCTDSQLRPQAAPS